MRAAEMVRAAGGVIISRLMPRQPIPSPSGGQPPATFEQALSELEQILADIEGGELGLEESLKRYERGNVLIQHCRTVLSAAEKQIEVLNAAAAAGDGASVQPPAPE